MASMKESDTGLWLHNKLGSTDELWTPPSIASLLTVSVIDNIRLCFSSLSPPVKLKLLLGMLHLPRRTMDEMKEALSEIIQLATVDSEPWVLMVADILKSFPETGSLNLDLEEQNPNVQDILGELREKVSECEASAMLPLECQYLNKSALTTLVGPLTPPVKHFQLKRKPKSATLRAELLQKSTETAQQLKKTAGVPFHAKGRGLVKKIDTTTPLKGIPKAPFRSPTAPSMFSPPSNRTPIAPARTPLRKERGVKLLDISELDVVGAGREAKRRRKTLETEAGEKAAKEEAVVENTTPDYAAGLVSAQKLGALNENPLPSTSYLPATPSMVPSSSYIPSSEAQPANAGGTGRETLQSARQPEESATVGAGATPTLPGQYKQRTPMYNASTTANPATPTSPSTPASTPANNGPPAAATATQPETPTQPPSAPQTPTTTPTPTPPQPQPKKNLSLTRDQMYAAQEMFKTANKVTRPEKALILGFMAGSRENPCPEQGDIIQIKLSEHTEVLPKADGTGSTTMLVDTVFEMNYSTGQWTRLKKYKPITNTS
ncbi:Negative elongation factor A [Scophthalmus maximus]|uniref:Negative elongation factor A n=2 Tax=Scophthalmus maximus TaxID=52904 RepID=A0A2U9B0Z8_SCOMX|nr:negative elongation factor A [Scophthalmus maximus]XP_035473464.1 negative elongation factor A [Scophthalmus maximus]XP_047192384.1 negative elongation factor A [Scophthalmus maximus]AWO97537.1 Negative elongation factor A [Scophthalmus maximus]